MGFNSSYPKGEYMQVKAVVKSTVYAGGQMVSIGRYYGRDDNLKTHEFMGSETEGLARIKTMQNAGYEFQHCLIREAKPKQ